MEGQHTSHPPPPQFNPNHNHPLPPPSHAHQDGSTPVPQFAWSGNEPLPAASLPHQQGQGQAHYQPPTHGQQQQQPEPSHSKHPHHSHSEVTFSTWDYLESLSDPSILPQHLTASGATHQPLLRVNPHAPALGGGSQLLTPASTVASSPRSAVSAPPNALHFSLPGVPALSPNGSPSTSSSMEPLPPRLPVLPGQMMAPPAPVGGGYNPYPYGSHYAPASGGMMAAYGSPQTGQFENTMFIKQTLPCGRQRIEQACEKCRERKARCNGGRPTCARCLQRGYECSYAPERRMRGPNKIKKQSSKGIQPRSSMASLSGSTNSKSHSPTTSTNTGTPSPTEESFSSAGQAIAASVSGLSAAEQGPRKMASMGNLGDGQARGTPSIGLPPSPLAVRPGMVRANSSAAIHERSLSSSSAGAGKPRLSVEAPPDPDMTNAASLFPSHSLRPELGLGMPTFPDAPIHPGAYGYLPPAAAAYMVAPTHPPSQNQHSAAAAAAYLPGIPLPHGLTSDFTPTAEGVQYLSYPYGLGAFPASPSHSHSGVPVPGLPFAQDALSGPEETHQLLASKGYGFNSHLGGGGMVEGGKGGMSPAQLAYFAGMGEDGQGLRGHSR